MTSLRIAVASMAVLGLASCASTDDRSGAYVPSEGSRSVVVSDDAYVARVEQIARRRGIDVQWVHIPTKRVARDDD